MTAFDASGRNGPLTGRHLDDLRDHVGDCRCQLIDGSLLVTPSGGRWHDLAVDRLTALLARQSPPGVEVTARRRDLQLGSHTRVTPDLVVSAADHVDGEPGAALLVVEVISGDSRHVDVVWKLDVYARAGIQSYWVVDPLAPSLTAWELQRRRYVCVAEVTGDDVATLTVPFPVQVRPSGLGID